MYLPGFILLQLLFITMFHWDRAYQETLHLMKRAKGLISHWTTFLKKKKCYFNFVYNHFVLGNMKNMQVIILTIDILWTYHSLPALNVDRTCLILIFKVVNTTHMGFKILFGFQLLINILMLYIQTEECYIAKSIYIFVYKHSWKF